MARESVVRLDVASCDQRWMGSGFLVADNLVMTAAHMADGATSISVQQANAVTTARLVALDRTSDSALLRIQTRLTAPTLQLTTQRPELGTSLGILGYPLEAFDLRMSQGVVSGLDEDVSYGDYSVRHAYVTDAAVNPGNSGGPVIDHAGQALGLVTGKRRYVNGASTSPEPVEGVGYVVPADQLASNLAKWRARTDQEPQSCGPGDQQVGNPSNGLSVRIDSTHALAADLARSLALHGQAINQGRYETAWDVFTDKMQRSLGSVEKWSSGLATSYWISLTIEDVVTSGNTAVVRTKLQTQQDAAHGPSGQTCSNWAMQYSMVNNRGGWLIDEAKNLAGSPKGC